MRAKQEQSSEKKVAQITTHSFSAKDKKLYTEAKNICMDSYGNLKSETIKLVTALNLIASKKLYEIDGYTNIYAFADDNFGIARGTCHGFIKIGQRFMEKSSTGKISGLKEEYKDYSVSKLLFLTSIKDEELKNYTPDMTVKNMSELKKLKSSPLLGAEADVELSDNTDSIISPFFDETFNSYEDLLGYQENIEKKWEEAKKKNPKALIRIVVEV